MSRFKSYFYDYTVLGCGFSYDYSTLTLPTFAVIEAGSLLAYSRTVAKANTTLLTSPQCGLWSRGTYVPFHGHTTFGPWLEAFANFSLLSLSKRDHQDHANCHHHCHSDFHLEKHLEALKIVQLVNALMALKNYQMVSVCRWPDPNTRECCESKQKRASGIKAFRH